jgi:hypothetical protein
MLVPAAVLLIPLAVANAVARAFLLGRHAAIVNHDLQGMPNVDGPLETTGLVVLVAALLLTGLALLVCLAAGIVMTAGQLLDRPVRATTALAAALRRLPTLLAFVLLTGLLAAATLLVLRTLTPPIWLVVALPVATGLLVLPYVTGLSAAILERRGFFGAFRRAAAVTRFRQVEVAVALLFGVGLVPALTALAGWLAPRAVGGPANPLVEQLVDTAGDTLALPFAAATLAAVYLTSSDNGESRDQALRGRRWPAWQAGKVLAVADRDRILAHLPVGAPPATTMGRGLRRGGVLAVALALPGLLHAGYVWSNPLDLAAVSDRVVLTSADGYPGALPQVHHDPTGRLVAMWAPGRPGYWSAGALVCGDLDCAEHPRLSSSEIADGGSPGEAPWWDTAPLPDGSVAVAAWLPNPAAGRAGDPDYLLLLGDCRADRCGLPSPGSAPVLAEDTHSGGETAYYLAAAVAARPDGGVVVAHVRDNEANLANLGLTICADLRCAPAETVVLARDVSPYAFGLDRVRPVDVAVGPGGTVVIAVRDLEDGSVSLYTCALPACQQPAETEVVGPAPRGVFASDHAVEVAVRPDGTPVLAYARAPDGRARLLVCHTRDCADRSDIGLSDGSGPPPALALDQRGWPLAATYQDRALVLVRCTDARCGGRESLPLAAIRHGPGHLDLVLTPDGRPQVLWADHEYLGDLLPRGPQHYAISLRLTTCAEPGCR